MSYYELNLEPDDNDTVLVRCPALPEVITFGKDWDDALRRAVEAVHVAIASRQIGRAHV